MTDILVAKMAVSRITNRILRSYGQCACSSSTRSTAPAPLLERIVNRQRVVPHETIRTLCTSMAAAKERFHIVYGRPTVSERADSLHIKIVRQRLCDISRRYD